MLPIDLTKLAQYFMYQANDPITFVSPFFLVLFTAFFAVFLLVYRHHWTKIVYLTLFSIFFYYKSSGLYFVLLLISAVSDYSLALLLHHAVKPWKRKTILTVSVMLNLGLLGYFKYTYFFLGLFNSVSTHQIPVWDIFLPVGISFFTFQSISYIVDVYRKEIAPLTNLLEYCFFISFFPQLVAGPILRAKEFIPQIKKPNVVTSIDFSQALFLIMTGLFKKAIISDYISVNFVDRIFDAPALYSGMENVWGVYAYAIQIYCDFSGYSDMAIGIALLLGYRLPLNFNSPYISTSITEFWRRWHISLSTWLKEYLYISLGGNRKGKFRQYLNLFLTMLLGGFWHGASLNFIVWGGLHGIALGLDKFIKERFPSPASKWSRFLGFLFTFHFVCFCWIFFRAADFETARAMLHQMVFSFHPELFLQVIQGYHVVLLLLLCGFVLHLAPEGCTHQAFQYFNASPLIVKSLLLSGLLFLVAQMRSADIQPFIYFQF
jgi:D-alanyl-lipoteichoic acid acyltransferase DltB (MBOAT superfamily)